MARSFKWVPMAYVFLCRNGENCPRIIIKYSLMLSMLGKISADDSWKYFSYFSKKNGFDIRRQFSWNVKANFLGKMRKLVNLSSANLAQRVIKINKSSVFPYFLCPSNNSWQQRKLRNLSSLFIFRLICIFMQIHTNSLDTIEENIITRDVEKETGQVRYLFNDRFHVSVFVTQLAFYINL